MNKTKSWLTVTPDNVTIQLSHATILNGVKQDKITLRVPTVGDLRAATKQGKGDSEAQDVFLFSALSECSPADIDRLTLKDYSRVQEGYFRLINDDDGDGIKETGQAAGD